MCIKLKKNSINAVWMFMCDTFYHCIIIYGIQFSCSWVCGVSLESFFSLHFCHSHFHLFSSLWIMSLRNENIHWCKLMLPSILFYLLQRLIGRNFEINSFMQNKNLLLSKGVKKHCKSSFWRRSMILKDDLKNKYSHIVNLRYKFFQFFVCLNLLL